MSLHFPLSIGCLNQTSPIFSEPNPSEFAEFISAEPQVKFFDPTAVPPGQFPEFEEPEILPAVVPNPEILPTDAPNPDHNQPVRHSTRQHKFPTYLQDYHCYSAVATSLCAGKLYPLSSTLSYNHLSSSHKAFFITLSTHKEPESYFQAIKDPKWQEVMKAEIDSNLSA